MCVWSVIPMVAGAALSIGEGFAQADIQGAQLDTAAEQRKAANVLEANDREKRMKSLISQNMLNASASGVDNSVGSPVDLAKDTASQFAREQFNADYNTKIEVGNYKTRKKIAKAGAWSNGADSLFSFGSALTDWAEV